MLRRHPSPRRGAVEGEAAVTNRRLLPWAAAAMVGVSVAEVTAQADTVQVVSLQVAVAGCDPLGVVRGSSLMGILLENAGYENTLEEMKTRTLELGGTHLLVREIKNGVIGSNGWGEAFICTNASNLEPRPRRRR